MNKGGYFNPEHLKESLVKINNTKGEVILSPEVVEDLRTSIAIKYGLFIMPARQSSKSYWFDHYEPIIVSEITIDKMFRKAGK